MRLVRNTFSIFREESISAKLMAKIQMIVSPLKSLGGISQSESLCFWDQRLHSVNRQSYSFKEAFAAPRNRRKRKIVFFRGVSCRRKANENEKRYQFSLSLCFELGFLKRCL